VVPADFDVVEAEPVAKIIPAMADENAKTAAEASSRIVEAPSLPGLAAVQAAEEAAAAKAAAAKAAAAKAAAEEEAAAKAAAEEAAAAKAAEERGGAEPPKARRKSFLARQSMSEQERMDLLRKEALERNVK
jgi:hypothetical protein